MGFLRFKEKDDRPSLYSRDLDRPTSDQHRPQLRLVTAEPVAEQDFQTVYSELKAQSAGDFDTATLKLFLERLEAADEKVKLLNLENIKGLLRLIKEHVQKIDGALLEIDRMIEKLQGEVTKSKGEEARSIDERTMQALEETKKKLMKDKLRAFLVLRTVLEVYNLIHNSCSERSEAINGIRAQMAELMAAEARAKQAAELIVRVNALVHKGEVEIEKAISTISPTLLEVVRVTVDLQVETILTGSMALRTLDQYFEAQLDQEFEAAGSLLANYALLEEKVASAGDIVRLKGLLSAESAELDLKEEERVLVEAENVVSGRMDKRKVIEEQKETGGVSIIWQKMSGSIDPVAKNELKFGEIKSIYHLMGASDEAAENISTLLSVRPSLSAEEMAEISGWFPSNLKLHICLAEYPNAPEVVLLNLARNFRLIDGRSVTSFDLALLFQKPSLPLSVDEILGREIQGWRSGESALLFVKNLRDRRSSYYHTFIDNLANSPGAWQYYRNADALEQEMLKDESLPQDIVGKLWGRTRRFSLHFLRHPNFPENIFEHVYLDPNLSGPMAETLVCCPNISAKGLAYVALKCSSEYQKLILQHKNCTAAVATLLKNSTDKDVKKIAESFTTKPS